MLENIWKNQDTISMFLQENYMDPALVPVTFPEQKRNLVYIFMESVESTYASIDVGGAFAENDIPEMTQLAMENVNFFDRRYAGRADSF